MDINGINQSLLDHNSFSNELQAHNNTIREHNTNVLQAFNQAESTRKDSRDVDDIWHGVAGPLQSGLALYQSASKFKDMAQYGDGGFAGAAQYLSDTTQDRVGAIRDGIASVTGGQSTAEKAQAARTAAFSAPPPAPVVPKPAFGLKQPQPGDTPPAPPDDAPVMMSQQAIDTRGPTTGLIKDDDVAAEKSSSLLPTSVEGAVGRIAGAFGLSDEASGAVGNLATKIGGIAGGGLTLVGQVEGEDKTGLQKAGADLSDIGAGLDIVGTFIPVLEPLGALASAAGGIVDGISDVEQNISTAKGNKNTLAEGTESVQTAVSQKSLAVGGASTERQQGGGSTGSF